MVSSMQGHVLSSADTQDGEEEVSALAATKMQDSSAVDLLEDSSKDQNTTAGSRNSTAAKPEARAMNETEKRQQSVARANIMPNPVRSAHRLLRGMSHRVSQGSLNSVFPAS